MRFHEFFKEKFCKSTSISVSGDEFYIQKFVKMLQVYVSMTYRFHEFLYNFNFWWVFKIWPNSGPSKSCPDLSGPVQQPSSPRTTVPIAAFILQYTKTFLLCRKAQTFRPPPLPPPDCPRLILLHVQQFGKFKKLFVKSQCEKLLIFFEIVVI